MPFRQAQGREPAEGQRGTQGAGVDSCIDGAAAVGQTWSAPLLFVLDHPLGLIAGNNAYPLILAREARAAGVKRIVAAAFTGETDPKLAELVCPTI